MDQDMPSFYYQLLMATNFCFLSLCQKLGEKEGRRWSIFYQFLNLWNLEAIDIFSKQKIIKENMSANGFPNSHQR